jgi:hypothetical protein
MPRYRQYQTEYSSKPYPEFAGTAYGRAYAGSPQSIPQEQVDSEEQYATSAETAAKYPWVEQVAKERALFEQQANYLMSQGMTMQDAYKKSKSLIDSEKKARIAEVDNLISSKEEDARYRADFSEFKSKMAKINYQNLATADQEINNVLAEYSHLSGSHDPLMAKAYDTTQQNALRRYQSSYSAVSKRLPQGVPVEAVLDEFGRPNVNLINDAISNRLQQKAEAAVTTAGGVAGAKADVYVGKVLPAKEEIKGREMEKQSDIKVGEQLKMIPGRVQEAVEKAKGVEPYKQKSAIEWLNEPKPTVTTSSEDDKKKILHSLADELGPNATKENLMDLAKQRGYTF